jgi:hypothetical protein
LDKDELERIEEIDVEILSDLVNFLKKFQVASLCLEVSKKPTLHLVIPWYKDLLEHCKVIASDNEVTKKIKVVVAEKLIEKIKIHELHKLAIFFNPLMKKLKILESDDAIWVKDEIKRQCANLTINNDDVGADSNNDDDMQTISSTSNSNVELGDFSKYYDDSDDEVDDKDEVDLYLSTKIQKDNNFDILKWWKDHQHVYPKLSRLAAYYLSIPCSSAPSERKFSAAGLTVNELRSNLNPQTVDSILVLRSSLQ